MNLLGINFGDSPYKKYKNTPAEKLNMAQQFENWTVEIDKNYIDVKDEFRINKPGNTDPNEYNKILNQLSKDYIKMMDENKDGKISYDEFERFHEEELKDNTDNISDEELEELKQSLKLIYSRLNADNEQDSKDNLDEREIMAYFFTMDAFNENFRADGKITKAEYAETGIGLADKENYGNNMAKLIKNNYESFFKNYDL